MEIQLAHVMKRMADRDITITINEAAKKYLAEKGFDPEYGARPIKRLIQKMILDKLADKLIKGELKDGSKIKVNFKENSLVFSR